MKKPLLCAIVVIGFLAGFNFCNAFGQATQNVPGWVSSSSEKQTDAVHTGSAHGGRQLWRSAGAVLFVLGALVGVNIYLRKRAQQWGGRGLRRMQVLERLALDSRQNLLMIKVDGREIVLAVSPRQVVKVADVSAGETVAQVKEEKPS
ncbi:MAG: FliO/MopB family protein [Lentisphaerae bacterium]|nr:FliO/MopB family protein [Lentisphaerota bacterium]